MSKQFEQHPHTTQMRTPLSAAPIAPSFPEELRKILSEVANNGTCTWLSWLDELSSSSSNTAQPAAAAKVKRRKRKRKQPPSTTQPEQQSGNYESEGAAYECDSEGTSVDSSTEEVQITDETQQKSSSFSSLSQAFPTAITLVLDHAYKTLGGYKLSPAEVRKNAGSSEDEVFMQRRQRLVDLTARKHPPPFTIQRLAEVLLTPGRYYRQTHKLCNCLEKLLLVTSSIHSFGGSTGGPTSQSRREVRQRDMRLYCVCVV